MNENEALHGSGSPLPEDAAKNEATNEAIRREPTAEEIEAKRAMAETIERNRAFDAAKKQHVGDAGGVAGLSRDPVVKALGGDANSNIPIDSKPRIDPATAPPRYTLTYRASDTHPHLRHDIYTFSKEYGADVTSQHTSAGRTYTIQPIKFKGVEINNFEPVGNAVLATDDQSRHVMLNDLADEYAPEGQQQ